MRHCEIDGVARAPEGDYVAQAKENHRDRVRPFGSLWTVSEGTNEDDENNTNVEFEEDFEDNFTRAFRQEVESIVGAVRCGRFDELWEQGLERLIDPINGTRLTKKKAR